MNSAVTLAAAAVAAKHAQVQLALAAKLAKTNASSGQSVVDLIEAANANLQAIAKSALQPGVGATLDISA